MDNDTVIVQGHPIKRGKAIPELVILLSMMRELTAVFGEAIFHDPQHSQHR